MRHYFAAVSPLGSSVHVSLWDSDEQANRMSQLNEMIVSLRSHAEAVAVGFVPIVNYPIIWTLP
jgi:hypothetical protein